MLTRILSAMDKYFQTLSVLNEIWIYIRRHFLQQKYRRRREYYHGLSKEKKLVYREKDIIKQIRNRLHKRGYSPTLRKVGEVHTFAFIPDRGWHHHLIPDLKELGPVTWFDCNLSNNYGTEIPDKQSNELIRRKLINDDVINALREADAKKQVDMVFVYASGREVSHDTIKRISKKMGIPTVNMCLDDKHSWQGKWMGDHRGGQIDIAAEFDISWTSSRVACEWYLAEGARSLYMPEGFDKNSNNIHDIKQDIPVSFVGGAYGFRPSVISYLKKNGIDVKVFGKGWKGGKWVDNVAEVYNRSLINLGMGGIGYCENMTTIKGRDFEIPGTGGGVYLTTFNSDLAQHFVIGKEILCYHNRDELLELIRYYLAHQDEARVIAQRGRERCIKEHRWFHRYKKISQLLGIIDEV